MIKIVCFKWKYKGGIKLPSLHVVGKYTANHVNSLYHAVQRNLTIPHEFICVTDDPEGIECRTIPMWNKYRELGGCFSRLFVFSDQVRHILGDRFVCLDLDVIITGNLDRLFGRTDDFAISKYYDKGRYKQQYYNGSIIMMKAGTKRKVWDTFEPDISLPIIDEYQKKGRIIGTDQAWISYTLGKGEKVLDEKDGVYTFLQLKKRSLPTNACIVTFPGKRDPSQFRHIPWVNQYYFNHETG